MWFIVEYRISESAERVAQGLAQKRLYSTICACFKIINRNIELNGIAYYIT